MAADDIAKGALHLIRWGKKIIPATADEIEKFGKNVPRVKSLLRKVENMSDDAARIVKEAELTSHRDMGQTLWATSKNKMWQAARDNDRARQFVNVDDLITDRFEASPYIGDLKMNQNFMDAVNRAGTSESVADLITPNSYTRFANPLAAGRRFEMTVPNAPEGFTNTARTLSERGLVSAPKDIEMARRISMLPPHLQEVYFSLLQDGTDPMAMLTAMKLLG